jgi:hypothetical protein
MKNDKYKIILEQKDNNYIFSNIEYEVFHKSGQLEKGYDEFRTKLQDKIKFFEVNNIDLKENSIDINKNNNNKHFQISNKMDLKHLLIQNFIRSVFLIGSFLIIFLIVGSSISSVVKKNEIKGGRQFWKNFENEIVKLSEKEIDQDTQRRIIESIRKIGDKYKPFIDELKEITN